MPKSTRETDGQAVSGIPRKNGRRLGDALQATIEPVERRKLPRGASSLPRSVVEEEQKKRLITATAHVVAEKGYANATITDITNAAGVSRATFYELFSDKEECFLYGFYKLSNAHVRAYEYELRRDLPLPERIVAATTAYLKRIDADYALARAYMAEASSATEKSRAAYFDVQKRLRRSLEIWFDEVRRQYPDVPPLGEMDMSLMLAGQHGYLVEQVRNGRPFTEQELLGMVRYTLACFHLYGWAAHLTDGKFGLPQQT